MRRPHLMAALLAAIWAVPALEASAQASRTTEQALFRLEDDWTRALVRRDAAGFDRILASAWVYSDEHGIIGKKAAIAEFTTGSDTVTAASNEGMKAYVYGDAAVVIGVLITEGRGKSGPFRHRYRYTDTWARIGTRWRCVASQDYDIPLK